MSLRRTVFERLYRRAEGAIPGKSPGGGGPGGVALKQSRSGCSDSFIVTFAYCPPVNLRPRLVAVEVQRVTLGHLRRRRDEDPKDIGRADD